MAGKFPSSSLKVVAFDDSSDKEEKEEEDRGHDLDLGVSLEKLNLGPRKKLLVLGPGGLLVHRRFRYGKGRNVVAGNNSPDGIAGNFHVFKRADCTDFLKFCFERFEVGIWSSAKEWNMDTLLGIMMGDLKNDFLFRWDQEKCTETGFPSLEKKEKPLVLKELRKLWEDPTLSRRCGHYSSSNTLLIDDEPCKGLLNPPNTAIFPPSYKAGKSDDNILGPTGELRLFLDGLAHADDVPSYVKEHPIGQPAITEAHPDWYYYSKVIRKLRYLGAKKRNST